MNPQKKPVAVIVGATSKWQSNGRNTKLAHGRELDDSYLPVGVRWGIGGAIAQKFSSEGYFVVLTTRTAANAGPLEIAIKEQDGECMTVELDLVSPESISNAFLESAMKPEPLMFWSITRVILKGVTFRQGKNSWSIFLTKCLKPHSTLPVEDRSWWLKKLCQECERRVKDLS